MLEALGIGLAFGALAGIGLAVLVCSGIMIRSLRPLGWVVLIALIVFLLTRL